MREQFSQLRRRLNRNEEHEQGFTLIELLIVIVVLGILAGIAIFALTGVTKQSAQAACSADAKSVETAIAAYNTQNGGYPSGGTTGIETALTSTGAGGPYLHSYPLSTHYAITPNTDASGDATGDVTITPLLASGTYDFDTTPNACSNVK